MKFFRNALSLTVSILLVTAPVQQALAKAAKNGVPRAYIDKSDTFFGGQDRLVIDGATYTSGLFGFSYSDAMKSDPVAYDYAKLAETYSAWGNGLMLGSLGLAIGYLVTAPEDQFGNSTFNLGAYFLILLAGYVPGVFLVAGSSTKLIRSINQYNGVYNSEAKTAGLDIGVVPMQNGLGLGFSF